MIRLTGLQVPTMWRLISPGNALISATIVPAGAEYCDSVDEKFDGPLLIQMLSGANWITVAVRFGSAWHRTPPHDELLVMINYNRK